MESYSSALKSIRSSALAGQEGVTADDARAAFQSGEELARNLGRQNLDKQTAYERATRSVTDLKSQLTAVAETGNAEIRNIQASNDLLPAKIARITEVVLHSQTEANARAGWCADNVYDAIKYIFNATSIDYSPRKFAQEHGVDPRFGSPSKEAVEHAVKSKLGATGDATSPLSGSSSIRNSDVSALPNENSSSGSDAVPTGAQTVSNSVPTGSNTITSPNPVGSNEEPVRNAGTVLNGQGIASPKGSVPPPLPAGGTSSTIPAGASPLPAMQQATTPNIGAVSPISQTPSAPTNALSPEGFAQNFNAGAQAGTPMSAGTEALSTSAAHAVQPQAPLHTEAMSTPMASTAPTAAAPIFETAHAATPIEAPVAQAPVADAPQTVVAAPAAAAAPPVQAPAAPIAPAGPLPAYGADLRPAASTAPAGPAPTPPAAPASAPVSPNSANSLAQPAVVRQQPAPLAAATPAGLTENAVAATATGAMAGASAAQTQAQQRLHRLLDAVARQEPQLRWAIGDRDDASTTLATDLASGWIPPHIEIPTGLHLPTPAHRRANLAALLGDTTLTAAYTPGQFIPKAEDTEPVSMSIRPRQTPDVEDLGWELAQATKWRDGLPRLAHTLAKAASTGTGYLDSEVDLLREHLTTVARQVLGDYPDNVDPAKVGNWQLLATIDALIKGEKTSANYHFAWFQALNMAVRGEERR